jgi:ferredoxin
MAALHVAIDPELCAASQMCVAIAPQLFQIDPDTGQVTPRRDRIEGDDAVELAREAETSCPMFAIRSTPAG